MTLINIQAHSSPGFRRNKYKVKNKSTEEVHNFQHREETDVLNTKGSHSFETSSHGSYFA